MANLFDRNILATQNDEGTNENHPDYGSEGFRFES
jgi:hypothetical protein